MPKGVYPHSHIKPKVYPADMVRSVQSMYSIGFTQKEIGDSLGVSQKVIYRLMKNHGIATRVAAKRDQVGERNSSWKGSRATYSAFHARVVAARGKPSLCKCGKTKGRFEWANLTGKYDDVWDYERMCVSCHKLFDAERRRKSGTFTAKHVPRSAKEIACDGD